MTTTTTIRLAGSVAIDYAERHGLTLSKYADPTEDARNGVSTAEARKIAREDPSLIYLEITHADIDRAFDAIASAALGSGRDADDRPDGSDDWDHPSAADARAITEALGLVWDFQTWADARALAHAAMTGARTSTDGD